MTRESSEAMKVAEGVVVELTFVVIEVLEEGPGEVLDDAWSRERYAYIQGRGQMPVGFEEGVEGLGVDDIFEFDVEPARAYGAHNNQMVQKIHASQLPPGLRPGMVIQMELPGQPEGVPPLIFHVKSVSQDGLVRLDGNHPFAGKTLRFAGKIRGARLATEEEARTGRIRRG